MILLSYFVFYITISEIDNTIISVPLYKGKPFFYQELEIYSNKNEISVYSILNTQYYFNLSIGNPLQTFKMKLDTNSKDLWVLFKKSQNGDEEYEEVAKLHSIYDESKSNTSFPVNKIKILPDSSRGSLCIDDISLGSFKIKRQVFLGVNEITPDKLINMVNDGVLGLAYSNFTFKNYNSLFYNMIDQGIISRPIISLYLNRDLEGQILFGGLRPMQRNWSFIPLKKKMWEIPIDNIQINNRKNYKFCDDDNCKAIIDTGSYLIRGPNFEISEINDYIGAVPFLLKDTFAINCKYLSSIPSISFILNGFNLTLTPYDYTRKIQYYGHLICISIFQSNMVNPNKNDDDDDEALSKYWTLGTTFMEIYHTALDFGNKRIGFVKANE